MIAIDPGVHLCGVAKFTSTKLSAAWLFRDKGRVSLREQVREVVGVDTDVVVEVPRYYPRSPVPPNDLIDLAFSAGVLASVCGPIVKWYTPHEWKRTVPKKVLAARMEKRLDANEQRVMLVLLKSMEAPSLIHNVWDAVGLGLRHLGRL